MSSVLKFILGKLIEEIVSAVKQAISDYVALQKKRKEDRKVVDEAVKDPDAVNRARRIRDLLS